MFRNLKLARFVSERVRFILPCMSIICQVVDNRISTLAPHAVCICFVFLCACFYLVALGRFFMTFAVA